MLNTRLRKQIEWHFYNYEAGRKLYQSKAEDIIYAVPPPKYIPDNCPRRGSPTESKAVKLWELDCDKNWAGVVRNTFLAFRFEPEFALMKRLYIERERWREVIESGVNESTFWYWRDRWLTTALMWAKEYKLL